MRLGREVVSGEGVVLLDAGIRLTQSQITNLRAWGVFHVDICEHPAKVAQVSGKISLTMAQFLDEYVHTVDELKYAFEHIRYFKEVPLLQMQELAEQRIELLVDTIGVLNYLYEIRLHNERTFQHLLNVAVMTGILGKWHDFKGARLKNLILAGLLHDIGKLSVPAAVLEKPGRLSSGEFEVIKQQKATG
jgi:HD-GYP domain-containing protein (c-di-GMP phosphodiesterase class II)